VLHRDGRPLGYDYHFVSLPIAAAKAQVLRTLFPRDVRVVWFVRKGTCGQMMVWSATLSRALGSTPIGDRAGAAMVEFGSGDGGSYKPRAVDDALFVLLRSSRRAGNPAAEDRARAARAPTPPSGRHVATLVSPHFEQQAKWACGPIFCDREAHC
jgi:hypothetical protein